MKLKSELFKQEQEQIRNKVIDLLGLQNQNYIVLYELAHNYALQEKIMSLVPDIKKFFSTNDVQNYKNAKKPYLSIIRHLLKVKFKIISKEVRMTHDSVKLKTRKIYFIPLDEYYLKN